MTVASGVCQREYLLQQGLWALHLAKTRAWTMLWRTFAASLFAIATSSVSGSCVASIAYASVVLHVQPVPYVNTSWKFRRSMRSEVRAPINGANPVRASRVSARPRSSGVN